MAATMQPQPMDLFSARYTSTPFTAVDQGELSEVALRTGSYHRAYASEAAMRRDRRNANATLYVLDRRTGGWTLLG